jgi:hypothetical protein
VSQLLYPYTPLPDSDDMTRNFYGTGGKGPPPFFNFKPKLILTRDVLILNQN